MAIGIPSRTMVLLYLISGGVVAGSSFDFPPGPTASGLCPGEYVTYTAVNPSTTVKGDAAGSLTCTAGPYDALPNVHQGNAVTDALITPNGNHRGVRFIYKPATRTTLGTSGFVPLDRITLDARNQWQSLSFAIDSFYSSGQWSADLYEYPDPDYAIDNLKNPPGNSPSFELVVDAEGKVEYFVSGGRYLSGQQPVTSPLAFYATSIQKGVELRAQWLVTCTTSTTTTVTNTTLCETSKPCEDEDIEDSEVDAPGSADGENCVSRLFAAGNHYHFAAKHAVALVGSLVVLGAAIAGLAAIAWRLSSRQALPLEAGDEELLATEFS